MTFMYHPKTSELRERVATVARRSETKDEGADNDKQNTLEVTCRMFGLLKMHAVAADVETALDVASAEVCSPHSDFNAGG